MGSAAGFTRQLPAAASGPAPDPDRVLAYLTRAPRLPVHRNLGGAGDGQLHAPAGAARAAGRGKGPGGGPGEGDAVLGHVARARLTRR